MRYQPRLQIDRVQLFPFHRPHEHDAVPGAGHRHVEALLVPRHRQRRLVHRVGDHGQEHDVALRALEGRAVAAQDRVALHHFLADGLRELGADQLRLLRADQGDDADGALLHVGTRQSATRSR